MNELKTLEELEDCLKVSEDRPILIYKHSTICPVSGAAQRQVQDYLNGEESAPNIFMVKVIESRPVSNAIAEQLEVLHQSPQLLLVKDRASLWNDSHLRLTAEAIQNAVGEFAG